MIATETLTFSSLNEFYRLRNMHQLFDIKLAVLRWIALAIIAYDAQFRMAYTCYQRIELGGSSMCMCTVFIRITCICIACFYRFDSYSIVRKQYSITVTVLWLIHVVATDLQFTFWLLVRFVLLLLSFSSIITIGIFIPFIYSNFSFFITALTVSSKHNWPFQH